MCYLQLQKMLRKKWDTRFSYWAQTICLWDFFWHLLIMTDLFSPSSDLTLEIEWVSQRQFIRTLLKFNWRSLNIFGSAVRVGRSEKDKLNSCPTKINWNPVQWQVLSGARCSCLPPTLLCHILVLVLANESIAGNCFPLFATTLHLPAWCSPITGLWHLQCWIAK